MFLASPRWKVTRARYFSRNPRRCRACRSTVGIELHHRHYKTRGQERDADLTPLCHDCHAAAHQLSRTKAWPLDQATDRLVAQIQRTPTKRARAPYWVNRDEIHERSKAARLGNPFHRFRKAATIFR